MAKQIGNHAGIYRREGACADNTLAHESSEAELKYINMVVDGCNVKLNFPVKADSTAISDIKRMMLGGVVKA